MKAPKNPKDYEKGGKYNPYTPDEWKERLKKQKEKEKEPPKNGLTGSIRYTDPSGLKHETFYDKGKKVAKASGYKEKKSGKIKYTQVTIDGETKPILPYSNEEKQVQQQNTTPKKPSKNQQVSGLNQPMSTRDDQLKYGNKLVAPKKEEKKKTNTGSGAILAAENLNWWEKLKRNVKGKVQRGKYGEGIQQSTGLRQTATMPAFDKSGQKITKIDKQTGEVKGVPTIYSLPKGDAAKIATDLVVGAATGKALYKPLALLSKALPKTMAAGSVLYLGNVGIRLSKTEKNPTKILKEFAGDLGFWGGVKIGGVKFNDINSVKISKTTGRKILNEEFGHSKKAPTTKEIKAKFRQARSNQKKKAKILKAYMSVYKKAPDLDVLFPKKLAKSKKASYNFAKRTKKPISKAELRKRSRNQAYSRKTFYDDKLQEVGIKFRDKKLKKYFVKEAVFRRSLKDGTYIYEEKGVRGNPALRGPAQTLKKSKAFPKNFGSQSVDKKGKSGVDVAILSNKNSKQLIAYQQLKTKVNKLGQIEFSKRKPIKKPQANGRLILINTQQATRSKPLKIDIPKRAPDQKPQVVVRGFRPGKSTEELMKRLNKIKKQREAQLKSQSKKQIPQYDVVVVPEYSRLPPHAEDLDLSLFPAEFRSNIKKIDPNAKTVSIDAPKIADKSTMKSYLEWQYKSDLKPAQKAKIRLKILENIDKLPKLTIQTLIRENVLNKADVTVKQSPKITPKEEQKGKSDQEIKPKEDVKPEPDKPKPKKIITRTVNDGFDGKNSRRGGDDKPPEKIIERTKIFKGPKVDITDVSIIRSDGKKKKESESEKKKKKKVLKRGNLKYTPTIEGLEYIAKRTEGKFTGIEGRGVQGPIVRVAKGGKTKEGRKSKVKPYKRRIPAVNKRNIGILKKYKMY